MSNFRLPRKIKKYLKRRMLYVYPQDPERKTYLVAWPHKYQQDYDAFRAGILRNIGSKK